MNAETPLATAEPKLENAGDFREAIGVLAQEILNAKTVQAAQGELLKAMDAKVRTLVQLVDSDHAELRKLIGPNAAPRPTRKGDFDA